MAEACLDLFFLNCYSWTKESSPNFFIVSGRAIFFKNGSHGFSGDFTFVILISLNSFFDLVLTKSWCLDPLELRVGDWKLTFEFLVEIYGEGDLVTFSTYVVKSTVPASTASCTVIFWTGLVFAVVSTRSASSGGSIVFFFFSFEGVKQSSLSALPGETLTGYVGESGPTLSVNFGDLLGLGYFLPKQFLSKYLAVLTVSFWLMTVMGVWVLTAGGLGDFLTFYTLRKGGILFFMFSSGLKIDSRSLLRVSGLSASTAATIRRREVLLINIWFGIEVTLSRVLEKLS